MRIAIGQLWQETNTFNPLPTTRRDFEQFGVLRGCELVEQMADTNELGGFVQSLRAWPDPPEIVGLVRLPAWPSGRATAETFIWLRDEMLAALKRALPVDALLLALHGAMVADEHPDVEGEILEAIREAVGPDLPIVATLDLHANVTEKMVRTSDALVLFHTAPHIDVFETGVRGAAVLRKLLDAAPARSASQGGLMSNRSVSEGGLISTRSVSEGASGTAGQARSSTRQSSNRPVTYFQKLPLVVPAERANTQDPASVSYALRERLQSLEQQPGILAAGLATVQPWLDIPELGTSVVVVSEGENAAAEAACRELADEVWNRRREYLPELTPLDEAVRVAHATREGLVVLSDSADATTSGAPGDSTWLLRELLKFDWPRGALLTLVSPEVVRQLVDAGVGARLPITVGGVRDNRFSQPLPLPEVVVENLFDARFTISGHLARNLAIDMGPSAVVRAGDVRMILTSRSGPHFAPELFQTAGIDPFAANVLVAKSPCGFRAAYAPRAAKILVVKAPGCAPSDFWNYEYREIPRPLWPWDEIER